MWSLFSHYRYWLSANKKVMTMTSLKWIFCLKYNQRKNGRILFKAQERIFHQFFFKISNVCFAEWAF
jgi:hypothetical protein